MNPLYQYITAVREIVLYGRAPSLSMMLAVTIIGIGTLVIGTAIFRKKQDKYIYYI